MPLLLPETQAETEAGTGAETDEEMTKTATEASSAVDEKGWICSEEVAVAVEVEVEAGAVTGEVTIEIAVAVAVDQLRPSATSSGHTVASSSGQWPTFPGSVLIVVVVCMIV